jgi:hypothetical protein
MPNNLPSPNQILGNNSRTPNQQVENNSNLPTPDEVLGKSALKKKEVSQSTQDDGVTSLDGSNKEKKKQSVSSNQQGKYSLPGEYLDYPGKGIRRYYNGKWYDYSFTETKNGKDLSVYDVQITDPVRVNTLNKKFNKVGSTSETEEVFTGFPGQEKNEYRIIEDKWQKKMPGMNKFRIVTNEGSIQSLNKEFNKNVSIPSNLEDLKKKQDQEIQSDKKLNSSLTWVNSGLIGSEEENASKILKQKFPGFEFIKQGPLTDELLVIAPNGARTNISLDNWTDEDDRNQSVVLREFIRNNSDQDLAKTAKELSLKESQERTFLEDKKKQSLEAGILSQDWKFENGKLTIETPLDKAKKSEEFKRIQSETKTARGEYMSEKAEQFDDIYYRFKNNPNKNDEMIAAYASVKADKQEISRVNNYVNDVKNVSNDVAKEKLNIENYANDIISKVQSGEISQQEFDDIYRPEIDQKTNDLNEKYKNLSNDLKNISTVDKSINESVGKNYLIKEATGSVIGGVTSKFIKGFTYLPRLASMGEMSSADQEEIVNLITGGGTTKEYMESEKRNDLTKALFSMSESVGILTSSSLLGGGAAAYPSFYAQSYYEMKDELDKIEGMSEKEKVLLSGSYGVVSSLLEKFGIDSAMQKTAVGKNLTNSIMKSAFSDLPKNASKEFIDAAIMNSFKKYVVKSGVQAAIGAGTEGITEALQNLSGVAIKEVYDQAKGTEYFNNKSAWNILGDAVYEGYLGALGGGIMSTVTSSKDIVARGLRATLNKEQIDALINSAKVDGVNEALITNLKSSILTGKMTKDEAKEISESFNLVKSKLESLPEDMSNEDKSVSLDLLIERDKLQKESSRLDEALRAPYNERITEINNELLKISENAVQKQTTGEVPVQPEATIGGEMEEGKPQAEPQGVTEEGQVAAKEEVDQYIANMGAEARIGSTINPIMDKMSNAEYINDNDIDNAIEKIFNEVDSLDKSDYSAETKAALSEKLLNIAEKLDNYEFRTKTETVATTKAGTATSARRTSEAVQKITAEKYFNGVNATVNGQEVTLVDRNGRVEATMPNGDVVVLDTPTMQIAEDGFEFDDNDALVAVNITDRLGNKTRITGDQALDFAIRDRENKIGVVEQADFDTVYQEVERRYVKEAPKKKVEKEAPVITEKAEPVDVEDEVKKLEELLKRDDPNFQLDSEITQEEKKEELVSKAIEKMSESDINDISEEAFDAEFPTPDVKTYAIEVKENSELANKLKRMGLKDLIGKKINLVMADQLKVGEVMGKKRMGGPFFPLIDKLFGKVAWASINKTAAKAIVNGAIKSDYTVVYNMNPSAIDSNAAITETFEDLMQSLPKNKQKAIFTAIQEQVLKNKYANKTDQVRAIAKSSKTLSEFFTELDKLDVDTISAVVKNIMPSRDVDAGTKIGKLLQNEGITIETIREMNVEQFASELPAGALTMVLEVTDKAGNKVTAKTADEAIITPEQQDEEGLPKHNNYPIYVRGKAVAMLNETVPFWNILKESINNINVKVAGIVREKSGRRLTSKEAISNEMRSASMTASVAKKAIEKTNTQYNRFLSTIARSFPNVEVVASQEEFDALLKDLNTKKLSTKNAKVYGAVYKGKLYLNPSLENYNTPVHEFGHVWINTAKVASKQLYSKGISLVKGTEYENNVRENKEYQRVIKQMKADGASDVDIDNYIYEEALATAIGDKGESFVTASQRLDFKNWMRKLFSFVKSMTGISKYSAEQLEDINLDEFVQAVSIDIMSGTELFKGVKTNISDALQLMTNGSKSIEYIMSVARDNGISDAGIKKYLTNQGFSEQAINDAFKAQPKAPSVAKVLGKPKPKQVTVNEMSALKDQIRFEAKAARDAKGDLNTKRRALADAIGGMVKTGKIKAPQAATLVNRISNLNLDNPVMVERFVNYAERVFERAEYQETLNKAFETRKSIRKALKTDNQPEVVGMAKEFTKIDPSMVEDIDAYIEMAEKVKNAVKPSVAKIPNPILKQAANIADISEYSKKEIERQEQIKADEFFAAYNEVEGLSKDMSLKEMKDIINSLKEDPEAEPNKQEKVMEFLKEKMSEMSDTLKSMFKTGIDPMTGEKITFDEKQKELIKRALKIDLNEISIREAIKIVESIDNFLTNQITSGLEAAVSSYEGAMNDKQLVQKGFKAKSLKFLRSGKIGRGYTEQLFSLPLMIEKMFGGINRSVEVMNKWGLSKLINGVNKANKQFSTIVDSYTKQPFYSTKNSLGVYVMNKGFMDAKNVYERGMLAFLKRNLIGTQAEMKAEFERRTRMIKESIDVLIQDGNSKEKKMGELYKEIYDKLNIASMDMDVINSNASKNNLDAINWWVNQWSKHYSDLSDISLSVYNTQLGSDLNYTPDKYKKLSSEKVKFDKEAVERNGSFAISIDYTDKNKSGVLIESTRPGALPNGRYVSLDFDTNNAKALKSALTDINTASAIRQIDGFMSSNSFKQLIPDSDDRKIITRRINTYIRRAKGKNIVPSDTMQDVERFGNFITALGVGKALGGVSQAVTQTVPVMLNTVVNAGRFDVAGAEFNAWLDDLGVSTSNRGLESQSTVESIDRQLEASNGNTQKIIKGVENLSQFYLKQFLSRPDIFVARSSFKSYYLQNLKRRGISTDIDWKTHKPDMEAVEYAEAMVNRQQNVSDPLLAGEFLASDEPMRKISRKAAFPFASFILNQKARMYNDFSTLASATSTNEDKIAAGRSLAGLAVELLAFQLIGFGIRRLYDSIAASLLGDDEEEEKNKKIFGIKMTSRMYNATKYPIKNIFNDIVSPFPGMTDKYVTWGLNEALSYYPWMDNKEVKDAVKERNRILELKGEDPMDAKTEAEFIKNVKDEATYQLFEDENDRSGGMYGIASATYNELFDISKLSITGEFIDDYQGRETTKRLLESDREKVKYAVPFMIAYSTGLLPKDVGTISNNYIKRIKKQAVTEKQYDRYDAVQKDLGRNLKSWEIQLVKDKKESETAISEIEFIERNGGLTERQGREYLKIMKAIGEPTVSDIVKIKEGQTADQILK